MESKFFIVDAVCGHVGKNNGIIRSFAIHAKDGREAAFRTRKTPRVKHDYKYAIRDVREVSFEEYLLQLMINGADPYFKATNRQVQDATCHNLEVFRMDELETDYQKKRKRVNLRLYDRRHCDDFTEIAC